MTPTVTAVLLAVLAFAAYRVLRIGSRAHGLPPGPPTVPLLGNILQFPIKNAHFKLAEWARRYGEVYTIKLGPGTAIFLNSPAAIKEILDKHSMDTIDRPPCYFNELVTDGMNLPLSRYSDRWRRMRKAANHLLSSSAVLDYLPIQEAESTQLVFDIATTPERYYTHIQRFSNSIILSIAYGQRSPRFETPSAVELVHATELWASINAPGKHPPIDLVPVLKWLPERLAPWKAESRTIRALQSKYYTEFFDQTEARIAASQEGRGDASYFMADLIRSQSAHGLDRLAMSYLGGALFEAGTDTSAHFLHSLVLLLIKYPETQARAREEVDRIVGERIPVYDDAESLPYLRAMLRETHRMMPVTPTGVPHRAQCDLNYKGYLIPKDAVIFPNVYAMFHDPDIFEDPDVFNPDRFLQTPHGTLSGVDDVDWRSTFVFGAGRRICPGMHLATASTTLAAMKLIWAFVFSPALDSNTGKEIPLRLDALCEGVSTGPKPFECMICPRGNGRLETLRKAFKVDAAPILSAFEHHLTKEDSEWLRDVRGDQ
ncbi:cytochrome P450 [Schizophyllum amplum]|uniref:Cytochrome P450 n=1 Tax=Schizophyllum amplum TaxID=97359 RepID=A0A550CZE5_9AGAR|nr:cytochrome P450 [Auriculariopsis ampla]